MRSVQCGYDECKRCGFAATRQPAQVNAILCQVRVENVAEAVIRELPDECSRLLQARKSDSYVAGRTAGLQRVCAALISVNRCEVDERLTAHANHCRCLALMSASVAKLLFSAG